MATYESLNAPTWQMQWLDDRNSPTIFNLLYTSKAYSGNFEENLDRKYQKNLKKLKIPKKQKIFFNIHQFDEYYTPSQLHQLQNLMNMTILQHSTNPVFIGSLNFQANV